MATSQNERESEMIEISYATVQDIIDHATELGLNNGDECLREDYSGRGMYGATCIGFVLHNDGDVLILGAAIAEAMGIDGYEIIKRAQQDSMGRGIIIYFPGVQLNSN